MKEHCSTEPLESYLCSLFLSCGADSVQCNDRFALGMPFANMENGLRGFTHWKGFVDYRRDLPRFDEIFEDA